MILFSQIGRTRSWRFSICIHIIIIVIVISFFSSDTSLRARIFVRNVRGVAQFDPWGHVAGGLGAIRAAYRACQVFKLFWPWAWIRQIPGFPQHPASCARTKGIPFFIVIYPLRAGQTQR